MSRPGLGLLPAAGAEAAGKSNLCLCAPNADVVKAYMDAGAGNSETGHRWWLQRPETQTMGSGAHGSGPCAVGAGPGGRGRFSDLHGVAVGGLLPFAARAGGTLARVTVTGRYAGNSRVAPQSTTASVTTKPKATPGIGLSARTTPGAVRVKITVTAPGEGPLGGHVSVNVPRPARPS